MLFPANLLASTKKIKIKAKSMKYKLSYTKTTT